MRESRTYGPVRGRSQMSVPMANNTQWTRSSDLLAFVPPHVPFAQKKKERLHYPTKRIGCLAAGAQLPARP